MAHNVISRDREHGGGPRLFTQIHDLLRGHEHETLEGLVEAEFGRLEKMGIKRRGSRTSSDRKLAEDNIARTIETGLVAWPWFPNPESMLTDPTLSLRWALVAILISREEGRRNSTKAVTSNRGHGLGYAVFDLGNDQIRFHMVALPLPTPGTQEAEIVLRW